LRSIWGCFKSNQTRRRLGDGNRKAGIEQFVDPGAEFRGEDSIATSDTLHQASMFTRLDLLQAAPGERERESGESDST